MTSILTSPQTTTAAPAQPALRPEVFTRRPRLAFEELLHTVCELHERQHDFVTRARDLTVTDDGTLRAKGHEEVRITSEGVWPAEPFRMAPTFDADVAAKLGIPAKYIHRLRTDPLLPGDIRLPLLAENINAMLAAQPDRQFLVRTYRGRGEEPAVARALLSTRYRIDDNKAFLASILNGFKQAGVPASELDISGEITHRRMFLRVMSTTVTADASVLVASYIDPFTGRRGRDYPLAAAGFSASNSEIGCGAKEMTPEITLQVCTNGMKITKNVTRKQHLGPELDDGVVMISDDTARTQLELISAYTRDAVASYLNPTYMAQVISELAADAGVPVSNAQEVLAQLRKPIGYTQEQEAEIFAHFLTSHDKTAGGIMHAMTSVAQSLPDVDAANLLKIRAIPAMREAAALARKASPAYR